MINRINKLRTSFDSLGVDAIFLTSRTSHRYFAGFDNEDGALLITKKNAYAFEDFRYIEVAEKQLKGTYEVVMLKGKRSEWLGGVLSSEEIKSLGFEDLHMSVSGYKRLCEDISVNTVPIGDTVNKIREIKMPDEIEK